MMNVEFEELPEGLQNVITAGSRLLGKDPVAVHEELEKIYSGQYEVIRGTKAIAAYLDISTRTLSRLLQSDNDLQDIIENHGTGKKLMARKVRLDLWRRLV